MDQSHNARHFLSLCSSSIALFVSIDHSCLRNSHIVCLVRGPEFCPVSLCLHSMLTNYVLKKMNRGIILEADTQKGHDSSSCACTLAFDKTDSQV